MILILMFNRVICFMEWLSMKLQEVGDLDEEKVLT